LYKYLARIQRRVAAKITASATKTAATIKQ